MTFQSQYLLIAAQFGDRIRSERLGRKSVLALLEADGRTEWQKGDSAVAAFLRWFRAQPGNVDSLPAKSGRRAEPLPTIPTPAFTPEEPTEEPFKLIENGDTATVEGPRDTEGRILTEEQLLAAANVDLKVWKVERCIINKYEMGSVPRRTGSDKEGWSRPHNDPTITPLYQVKLYLTRRTDELELRRLHDELLADTRDHAPRYRPLPRLAREAEHILVPGLMDLHVGRLVWEAETGGGPWSAQIARDRVLAAVEIMCAKAERDGVEKIILPIGNDLMHFDSNRNTTTAGTPQDVQGRYREMKRLAYQIMVDVVDTLRLVAPVHALSIPGNHGRESDMDICERLSAFYTHADDVTVSLDPRPRQYVQYGTNLLGFTHGDREKATRLPLLMPMEAKELWAETTYREFLIGHFHAKKETSFAPLIDHGVTVRVCPSLTTADAWHAESGYVGSWRSCEGYLYHRAFGYAGTVSVSARQLELA
jgi:hypothetical protein